MDTMASRRFGGAGLGLGLALLVVIPLLWVFGLYAVAAPLGAAVRAKAADPAWHPEGSVCICASR